MTSSAELCLFQITMSAATQGCVAMASVLTWMAATVVCVTAGTNSVPAGKSV